MLAAFLVCSLAVVALSPVVEAHLLGSPILWEGMDELGKRKRTEDPTGFDLNFQTQTDEFHDVPLKFDRPLPKWINGTLIRNGLGRFDLGPREFLHVFDAFAKLSSWRFPGNGEAFYTSRFLSSQFYQSSLAVKDIVPYLLFDGVTPEFSLLERVKALEHGADNMNVNIYRVPDTKDPKEKYGFLAITDYWKAYQIDPRNLSTVGAVYPSLDDGGLPGGIGLSSAHPLPEPGTPHHLTFLTQPAMFPWQTSTVSLIRIHSVHKRQVIAKWPVKRAPYMHSFSVTPNYAILFACPYFYDMVKIMETMRPMDGMIWDPKENTTVFIVRLKDGQVTTLQTEPVLTLHHINAYEKSAGELVVDTCAYSSPDFVVKAQVRILRDPKLRDSFDPHAHLHRYHISLNEESIRPEHMRGSSHVPFSVFFDMPVINEAAVRGKHYCYTYGLVIKWDNKTYGNFALVKKDLCSADGAGDRAWKEWNNYPGEAWFVPNPQGSGQEDDGVLLTPVLDGKARSSYLLVLDAHDLTEVARAKLPAMMASTVHGRFFPEGE